MENMTLDGYLTTIQNEGRKVKVNATSIDIDKLITDGTVEEFSFQQLKLHQERFTLDVVRNHGGGQQLEAFKLSTPDNRCGAIMVRLDKNKTKTEIHFYVTLRHTLEPMWAEMRNNILGAYDD